ncbi:phage tail protein [Rodentibacter pneumotropicus]|uniref:Phage tail protein n=2 Tax=Rodentibacter pneumotropicus TaxID=758 RepID=A0A4S2PSE5_9PAST|nr:phage tail protein [Rodentibacter pneumotropicus]THA06702.1 phage tail protein [Rodentibacter pneumotropicus]THA11560.1 phage tail protein [Rodentibacter pneumotropicus]THA14228.1 phage tail protein [Rodentibacter pneumotropicus]
MEIMAIYFKDGFYHDDFGGLVPKGAVEISEEKYVELLEGQAQGKHIIADSTGNPVLIEPQPSPAHELKEGEWIISPSKLTALFTQRKTALLQRIADKTDQFKAQYLQGYSQAEIDSFYRQEREARNELPEMILTEIFEGRDDLESIEELKKKVIEKADLFAIIMGKLFAIKQNFETYIEQAKTLEDLDKIEQEIEQWQKL